MAVRSVQPAKQPVDGHFRAPPSKSVTHRALVSAALASGPGKVVGPLDADDTRITRDGLSALGVVVRVEPDGWAVEGTAGRIVGGGEVKLGQSGTSLRFLLAVAALGGRPSVLDGAPRLRERPLRELTHALVELGARIEPTGGGEGLPLQAGGSRLQGGPVELRAERSSQFASAMLLIGSRLPGGLDLRLAGPHVSLPYLELTSQVLGAFGVRVDHPQPGHWRVAAGDYPGRRFEVEGDHSSASYLLAAAAVVGGRVRVSGLRADSLQPDARLADVLERLGCHVSRGSDFVEVRGSGRIAPFDIDARDAPDLVPTLAVLALFAEGPCRVRGAAHLRLKESDRLAALARNLRALGCGARATIDGLEVDGPPPQRPRGATVRTASDHRIAMAFAVAGLRLPGVVVDDADCVSKSNPDFWAQLSRLEG